MQHPHDFEWKDEYSVGVKEIDDQHKHFVKLIFKLFASIQKQKTRENLGKILDELIDFANEHFSTEEKYFEKFSYEGAKEHIEKHREFVDKMINLQIRHRDNEFEISYELIDFMEDWLLEHLTEMDQKYVECFSEHGLK